jgi:transposase
LGSLCCELKKCTCYLHYTAAGESRRGDKPRVSAGTPRERIVLDHGDHCPDCDGPLRLVGEDAAEIFE